MYIQKYMSRTVQTAMTRLSKTNSRAEPNVVDMEMTKTCGEMRKTNRINEYYKVLGGTYAHDVLLLSTSGHDRYDSVGGSALTASHD